VGAAGAVAAGMSAALPVVSEGAAVRPVAGSDAVGPATLSRDSPEVTAEDISSSATAAFTELTV